VVKRRAARIARQRFEDRCTRSNGHEHDSRPIRTPTVEGTLLYVVEEGDTLSSIAARFGVTEDALIQLNGLADPDDIEVGQILLVPPAEW
jgi:LysM repeat protein